MELAILSSGASRASLAFSLSDRKRVFWGLGCLEEELASLKLSLLVFGDLDFVCERIWEVLLACKFLPFLSLRVEELHDILGINRQSLGSLTTTIQRLLS